MFLSTEGHGWGVVYITLFEEGSKCYSLTPQGVALCSRRKVLLLKLEGLHDDACFVICPMSGISLYCINTFPVYTYVKLLEFPQLPLLLGDVYLIL